MIMPMILMPTVIKNSALVMKAALRSFFLFFFFLTEVAKWFDFSEKFVLCVLGCFFEAKLELSAGCVRKSKGM